MSSGKADALVMCTVECISYNAVTTVPYRTDSCSYQPCNDTGVVTVYSKRRSFFLSLAMLMPDASCLLLAAYYKLLATSYQLSMLPCQFLSGISPDAKDETRIITA